MYPLEASPFNMRVNLRRRNIRMAEHHLNRPKIRTAFEQMRRKRMPEHVRRNDLCNPCSPCTASQQFPKGLPRQRPTPPRNEHIS